MALYEPVAVSGNFNNAAVRYATTRMPKKTYLPSKILLTEKKIKILADIYDLKYLSIFKSK